MLKHLVTILCSILLLSVTLGAAPLVNTPIQVTQPDGSSLDIFASGDEFHNWLHDADNYTIMQDDAGYYVYAAQDGESVAPTDLIVGQDSPQQRSLQPGINLSQRLRGEKYARWTHMQDYSNGRSPHTGQFNNVVIFIKFADDPFFTTPISVYDQMFNDADGNSMNRYFTEASYNQLNVDSFFFPAPDGQTIICYTDIYDRNYFRVQTAANPQGYANDSQRTEREMQLLLRAVNAVGPQIPADLVIDGDNDGYVDNTCFIIKGSPDGWAELLWPHRWVLYGVNAYIHGKRVWDFNFQLETSTLSSGSSVLSHEMFHSLGAPDLYRYEDNTITPIGSWDLMASNTEPPQHMSVWMKHHYGEWVNDIPNITTSGTYTLSPVASSSTNNIYRIATWRTNEFYLLEYRKPSANYDHTVPGTGLLVYRLNTQESGNAQGPPDELYLYRPNASNTTTNGSLSMANYSAQSGRTEISEATIPSGFCSNNAPGGLNLYDVGQAGDTITFKVKVSNIQLTYPHGGETWFSGSNKTLLWKAKSLTGTVTVDYSLNGGNTWINLSTAAGNNGSFYWSNIPSMTSTQMHIRITQNSNGHSDSNTYPFTILSDMAVPEGTYPPNAATSIPTNPNLIWSNVPGATGYQVQVSATEDFSSFLVNELNYPNHSYQLSGLIPFHTYYWRVCSISEVGIGPFCESLYFTTGNLSELPQPPNLVYPGHMEIGLPLNVNFTWTDMPLADSYNLQISHDSFFVNPQFNIENIFNNTYSVSNLDPSSIYYWRVRSANIAGESNFSQINRFSTMAGVDNDDVQQPQAVNALAQNYPNPFNPTTSISLSVKDLNAPLKLQIFDIRGRLIRTLHDAPAGKHSFELVWDGKDANGQPVASGLYHYRMQSGDYAQTRKMLLMK